MATDFSKVVKAAVRVFGHEFFFKPNVSVGPNAPGYLVSGVYSNKIVDYNLSGTVVQSVNAQTMGILLRDFTVPPRQLDKIVYQDVAYDVADIQVDGQGGATLWLKKGKPSS